MSDLPKLMTREELEIAWDRHVDEIEALKAEVKRLRDALEPLVMFLDDEEMDQPLFADAIKALNHKEG